MPPERRVPAETWYECRLCGHAADAAGEAKGHASACPERAHDPAPYYKRRGKRPPRLVRGGKETFAERRVRRFKEEGLPL